MNNKQEKNHIAEKVLGKIKKGKIKMRPKMYFVLGAILLVLGFFLLVLLVPYLVSLIVFSLRVSGVLFLPKFGFSGMRTMFSSLPWLLILITISLIVLLEMFARKFTFVYRKPIIWSLLTIVGIISVGSFLISKTPLHSNLFWESQKKPLPTAGIIYRDFRPKRDTNIYNGIVVELIDNGFTMKTLYGDIFTISINPETKLMPDMNFQENDTVIVLGKIDNNIVQALDIHKEEQSFDGFLREDHGHMFFKK